MDWSLRSKLLVGFATVVVVSAALTVPAGSLLIGHLVVAEAERRVVLGLRTADAMLHLRMEEAQQGASALAAAAALRVEAGEGIDPPRLEAWRARYAFDFVQFADAEGRVAAQSRASAEGVVAGSGAKALADGKPVSGLALVPLQFLEREADSLA
ncbi:MAG: hypothetical protein FJX74_21145, partial [Armatimonadetes bacterium]|nr:hypothetical protein [Armatimonadota bacterium]